MAMISTNSRLFTGLSVTALLGRLSRMKQVRKQRTALKSRSSERLADLGVTRNQAQKEAGRPIWDVPSHWQR